MTRPTAAPSPGIIIRWPRAYDLLLRLMWGRRERSYRSHVLELAGIRQGMNVLDVGCGTGTQAIAARLLVGAEGHVSGVDPSAEMIARARSKASDRGVEVDFRKAAAQVLPFPDDSFDVVLSTTVVHCMPEQAREQCFREMARVLMPEGRLLLVDFGGAPSSRHSFAGHAGVHGRFDLNQEKPKLAEAGLIKLASGTVGFADLHYIVAARAVEQRQDRALTK